MISENTDGWPEPAALFLTITSIVTASSCEALRTRTEERLSTLEGNSEASRAALDAEMVAAHAKVAELEEVLTRASEIVTRNSADTGAQVETLAAQLIIEWTINHVSWISGGAQSTILMPPPSLFGYALKQQWQIYFFLIFYQKVF